MPGDYLDPESFKLEYQGRFNEKLKAVWNIWEDQHLINEIKALSAEDREKINQLVTHFFNDVEYAGIINTKPHGLHIARTGVTKENTGGIKILNQISTQAHNSLVKKCMEGFKLAGVVALTPKSTGDIGRTNDREIVIVPAFTTDDNGSLSCYRGFKIVFVDYSNQTGSNMDPSRQISNKYYLEVKIDSPTLEYLQQETPRLFHHVLRNASVIADPNLAICFDMALGTQNPKDSRPPHLQVIEVEKDRINGSVRTYADIRTNNLPEIQYYNSVNPFSKYLGFREEKATGLQDNTLITYNFTPNPRKAADLLSSYINLYKKQNPKLKPFLDLYK